MREQALLGCGIFILIVALLVGHRNSSPSKGLTRVNQDETCKQGEGELAQEDEEDEDEDEREDDEEELRAAVVDSSRSLVPPTDRKVMSVTRNDLD